MFELNFEDLCDYKNLEYAFIKARKGKTNKIYVRKFEENLQTNLKQLRNELLLHTYKPRPLKTFILRDPKTRKISKSDFRDRIIHHALVNIIEPIFEPTFIHDSYANRIKKGTFKAIDRFSHFKKKVSKNNTRTCFVLKADIRHYFETVKHQVLLNIIKKKVKDENILWLITVILDNYETVNKGVGMPLGNLTSQFFANVYLNELDQFIKHKLRIKYYIRYVDDFVIIDKSSKVLEKYKEEINKLLKEKLLIELHPDKSRILTLENGIEFLGFRNFYYHKLIRKKNLNKFGRNFKKLKNLYNQGKIKREDVVEKFQGWAAYITHANIYKYRREITKLFNNNFPIKKNEEIQNIKKHENFVKKIESSKFEYSPLKTLHFYNKGLNVEKIAEKRKLKTSTIWEHFAKLIENNQLSVWKILPKEKINKVFAKISALPFEKSEFKLKVIKNKLNDPSITYPEIACILASIKANNKKKNITFLIKGFMRTNCYRKCYFNPIQRKMCKEKFETFIKTNPILEMEKKEFIQFFNKNMTICILPKKQKEEYISWNKFKQKLNQRPKNTQKLISVKVNNVKN